MKQVSPQASPPSEQSEDSTSRQDRRSRVVVAAILLLLPLVYFSPTIFADFTLVPGDGLSQNLGVRVLIGRMLRDGQLPLWNPYIFAGTPLLASIYPGALYPPNWVFALFSPAAAMNIVVITTYHIALIGCYVFGRRIGMTRAGAIVAGVAFTFSGYLIAHMGHTSRIAAAVWLPWILLAVEHLYHRLIWRWVALGALFIALQLFAGEPQMSFYTVLVCGAYGFYSLVLREARERRLRFLCGLAAMSLCGLLLSMVQLLPERELLGLGERAAIPYEYFSGFSFPPANLFTFIFPFFFGGIYFGDEKFNSQYWGQSTIDETCGYFGLLTLLLALVALAGSARRSQARFWGVAAVASLVLAFGGYLPFELNHVLHQTPVYNLFRASGRHMFEVTFSMAMLAGLGASYIARAERKMLRRAALLGSIAFAALFAITLLVFRFSGHALEGGLPRLDVNISLARPEVLIPVATAALGLIALWSCVRWRNAFSVSFLAIVLVADLAAFGWIYNYAWKDFVADVDGQMKDPPTIQFIKSRETDPNAFRIAGFLMSASGKNYHGLNSPNVSIVRGLQSLNGYDAMRLPRTGAIAGDMTIEGVVGDVNVVGAEHQGFNLLNVKYLLRERPSATDPERTMEIDGVRFEKDGINLNLDPGTRAEVMMHQAMATELAIISAMGNAVHIADETPVARVRLHTSDGQAIERELRAGRDTAEWAYDRPEVRAAIKHRMPKIAESWPVEGFQGHRFIARFPFDRAQVNRVEFEYLPSDASVQIVRASLFDGQTGVSTALDMARLHPDRWRRLEQFGDVEVFENLKARPRAWFVRRAAVDWSAEVLEAIKTGTLKDGTAFDPAETALFEREDFGNREIVLPRIDEPVNAEVNVTRYEPNRIELRTRNGGAGFLVLGEIWYRGWEAWIDGRRAPVEKVNYALRGLAVPAGEHRIEFKFRAHSFRNGAAYSLLGVLLLLLGAGASRSGRARALAGGLESSIARIPSAIDFGLARIQATLGPVSRRVNLLGPLWLSRIAIAAFVIALLLYGNLLARKAAYAVGGSDSSGYARIARSLLNGAIVKPVPELALFDLPEEMIRSFMPLAYTYGPRPRTIAPFYPVGFPLHIAAAALIGGWEIGPFLVNPILAVLSLVLIYLTALELGLTRGYAMAGAVMLGGGATFIFMSLAAPMSDVTATCWALAAVWASLGSRKHDAWALLAGAAFGMAFLIRPTSVLLLAPILFALRLKPRALLYFFIGGLPMAAIFFAYNAAAYGHPLRTGYGAIGLFAEMKLTGFTTRFSHYAYWLSMTLSPLVVLGWLGVAFDRKVAWRDRALLVAWFGAFLLFHACYDVYDAWWYTRFLLPAVPALILGALLTARNLAGRLQRAWTRRVVLACLFLVVFGIERYYVEYFNVYVTGRVDAAHAASCRWADRTLPDRALLLSAQMSGALKFYTERPIVRWDETAPEQWKLLKQRSDERGYKWYALLTPYELDDARKRVPGKWTPMGAVEPISLWQIEPEF